MQIIHARRLYIGTTAERTATTPPADAIGATWYDTTLSQAFAWSGSAWGAMGGISGEVWLIHGQVVSTYITIAAALAAAAGGDTIFIYNGTYTETLTVSVTNLTLVGFGATITGAAAATLTITAAGVTLRNLTVTNTAAGAMSAHCVTWNSNNVTLDNVIASKTGGATTTADGFYQSGGTGAVLKRCTADITAGTSKYGYISDATVGVKIIGGEYNGSTYDVVMTDASSSMTMNFPILTNNKISLGGSQYGFYEDAAGNIVFLGSSVISGIDKAVVSRLAASDGSPDPALSADAAGNLTGVGNNTLAAGKDFFPAADAMGLARRAIYGTQFAPSSIFDDFNGGLAASWTGWASGVFGTPTLSYTSPPSTLKATFSSAPSRAFLYHGTVTINKTRVFSPALFTNNVGAYVALRMDNGTDDNYIEIGLRYYATNQFDWYSKYRIGGAAPVKVSQKVIEYPLAPIITLYPYGTYGSSWGFQSYLYFNSPGGYVVSPVSGLTWTPTRSGISFYHPSGGASWQAYYVDWYV